MNKLMTGKASVLAITFVSILLSFFFGTFITKHSPVYATPAASSTPSPGAFKVIVCHQDGRSGNYSRVEVSISSVDDANGLNGHGDHEGDVWSPYIYNDVNYPGQGAYSTFNFDTCEIGGTPTPTPVDTSTPTPTPTEQPCDGDCEPTPTPTPTPTVNPDVCANMDGIQSEVPQGMHLDPTGKDCLNWSESGAPESPSVSQGQVLGASTMAGTGSFDSVLYQVIMGIGATITSFGFKKALRKDN